MELRPPHCLQVYISGHCIGCAEAESLAREVAQRFPALRVEVIDVQQPDVRLPETVFATPTYLWDGKLYSLGNPSREVLVTMIAAYRAAEVDV